MNKKNMNGRGSKNPGKTLMRLLFYVWNYYKVECVFVAIGIAVSSLAAVAGNLFIKNLIDDYIMPFLSENNPSRIVIFKVYHISS